MKRGIVTIATGSERYYNMALNFLHSVRITNPEMNVAVLTDNGNQLTSEFDNVVILEHPYNSYMDKIDLLINCPYEENLFIDADSLVFSDLNPIWKCFEQTTDFSCFGRQLELDSDDGYFRRDDLGKYKERCHYITNLHGGLYFIRRGEYCQKLWEYCKEIEKEYSAFSFKIFREPADEPIIALACAIQNVELVDKLHMIAFLPIIKVKKSNIKKRRLVYKDCLSRKIYSAPILHFSNSNTKKAFYKFEKDIIDCMIEGKTVNFFQYKCKIRYLKYLYADNFAYGRYKDTCYRVSPKWAQRLYRRIRK